MTVDKLQLKELLKPLMKEMLKELLLEEKGILSHIITESIQAIKPHLSLVENNKENNIVSINSRTPPKTSKNQLSKYFQKLQEEKMNSGPPDVPPIVKKPALNRFFQGTTPIEVDPLAAIQEGVQSSPIGLSEYQIANPNISLPPSDILQEQQVIEDTNNYDFSNIELGPGAMAGESTPIVNIDETLKTYYKNK